MNAIHTPAAAMKVAPSAAAPDAIDMALAAWFGVTKVMPERDILRDRMKASLVAAGWSAAASTELRLVREEVARLNAIIHTPHTSDFLQAVSIEAEYQVQRWGTADREGKEPHDWFWLLGYLAGKALTAFLKGDQAKGLHHIVSSGAALMNWHRYTTGKSTAMRPGIGNPHVGAGS